MKKKEVLLIIIALTVVKQSAASTQIAGQSNAFKSHGLEQPTILAIGSGWERLKTSVGFEDAQATEIFQRDELDYLVLQQAINKFFFEYNAAKELGKTTWLKKTNDENKDLATNLTSFLNTISFSSNAYNFTHKQQASYTEWRSFAQTNIRKVLDAQNDIALILAQ